MALFSIANVRIAGIASAVPPGVADNLSLELLDKERREAFVARVGIRTRRIAPRSVCASDLCVAAAERLLEEAGCKPAEVGALVFVTQTPDFILPGNSVFAQTRLGMPTSAFLLDLNQGCAGYVYGLAALSSIMQAAQIDRGLLLVGDTISRLISLEDTSTVPIFSDAGSATLLEYRADADAMWFHMGCDGEGAAAISVDHGGARNPLSQESLTIRDAGPGIRRAPVHLGIQGVDVLHYCFRYVVPNIQQLLTRAGWSIEDPDFYVFHQANRLLNDGLARKLGLSRAKIPESLKDYGNTSSATIPVTMNYRLGECLARGKHKLLLSGFGVGFCWGSALVTTDRVLCPAMIELS
jgi:3-oxoacyl-[acyl-carrier-protein] synthase-3